MPKQIKPKPTAAMIRRNRSKLTGPQDTLPNAVTVQSHLISITPTTSDQMILHPYSNSRLTSMNQCPTWGVVSAQKQYPTQARSMALEVGEVMHQVFAAIRIWQLHTRMKLSKHAITVANRIFDKKRWLKCWEQAFESHGDDREELMVLAFQILHSSGFQDDPSDTTRTIANMELACIQYIDEVLPSMNNWPIYVADKANPKCYIGIENVFDVVLTYDDGKQYRFIGTLDALVFNEVKQRYTLEDNKTASRLDAGWKASFILSHQVTGYLACASALLGFDIFNSRILGLKIKPTNRGEDFWPIHPSRTNEDFQRWGFWFRHTADLYELYKDHYEYAPRYTHSCNRYFRPCSLIPFCADTHEGRIEQWNQMVAAKPSPSERAVEGQIEW